MNAVGIDVSKGKSMVAALRPMGELALKPHEVIHTQTGLENLVQLILGLGGDTRVAMEATGRYHEPVAAALMSKGIYVSVLNPILIKHSGAGSIRKVKTDKKDALKIAKYALDNWTNLREHTLTDTTRQQLKLFSRQYNLYMKTSVTLQNNLISLLDKTFPGIKGQFNSPVRADGHQKWVDFAMDFWHCDCVRRMSKAAFAARYQKWCKRRSYHFSTQKAEDVYALSLDLFTTLCKCDTTKLLIASATTELTAANKSMVLVRAEMTRLAKQLPEYKTVDAMYGAGDITAAQLIAELGDVRRFANRGAIIAFAGIDPAVNESGSQQRESNPSTKRGSPHLRKTLFQVVSTYVQHSPANEPVYQFVNKKRAEGKPYYVYMTAGANKFLRIYYARVKECLNEAENSDQE